MCHVSLETRLSASVTAIGFKGQRNNNNRGGGRRPGFEASMCTVRPLSEFEARRHHGCLSRCGERRRVGDTSVQAPTLEIHRKQRLPTDTAEETETRLGACPSAVLESRIHALIYNVSTFHVLL